MAGVDGARRPAAQRRWSGERRAPRCSRSPPAASFGGTGPRATGGRGGGWHAHRPRRPAPRPGTHDGRGRSRAASSAIRAASAAMVGRCNSRQATRMAASAAGSVIGFTRPPPPMQPPPGRLPHGRGVAASGCGRWRAGRHSCPVPVWAGRSGPGLVSHADRGDLCCVSVSGLAGPGPTRPLG